MKINDLTEGPYGLNNAKREKYAKKVSQALPDIEKALEQYAAEVAPALEQFKKGYGIYRGVPNARGILLVDPTKVERKAANTYNFMNIMQSSLPSWKGWPPRNKSLICSSSIRTAGMYSEFGGRYVVLPFGNPNIGIVPDEDWFRTFTTFGGPQWINRELADFYDAMMKVRHEPNPKGLPEGRPQFYKAIQEMDAWCKEYPMLLKEMRIDKFIAALLKYPSWMEGLNDLLDPKHQEFHLIPMNKYNVTGNFEIWFSAPALMVDADYLMKKFKIDKSKIK
jgi:hypothetical protein